MNTKHTFARKDLVKALRSVDKLVKRNKIKPILESILMEGMGDLWNLLATDLENFVAYEIPGENTSKEQFCLPYKEFKKFVSQAKSKNITISIDRDCAYVEAGSIGVGFNGLENPLNFPSAPIATLDETLILSEEKLQTALEQTIFTAAKKNSKYALASICFDFQTPYEVHIVSTDGKRLSLVPIRTENIETEWPQILLISIESAKVLLSLLKSKTKKREVNGFGIGLDNISFQFDKDSGILVVYGDFGHYWIQTKEGLYPKWRDVISHGFDHSFQIEVKSLLQATSQAKNLMTDEIASVDFCVKQGSLELVMDTESGSMKTRIEIDYRGDDATLLLNPKYVSEYLKSLFSSNVETVSVFFTNHKKPVIFESRGSFPLLFFGCTLLIRSK